MAEVRAAKLQASRSQRWLRRAFRVPVYLYRWRLGWLLGHRFVLLTHRGRRSGLPRRTVLEVLRYDPATRECVVVSGYGARADWYRNLRAAPALALQIGRERYAPAHRVLDAEETAREFREYRRRHPLAARLALRWFGAALGLPDDGTAASRRELVARMRMVAFRPR
ncbi:MAG TPA: nitroreductase family deazaflavin-dependent oxidoreductase [Thermomicrobiales bacterium]|nr:nitroreductase family deazaflavin-dependent oxidoreductase [Thermomicrobiales bacterium]